MSAIHEGGCLCHDVRYATTGDSLRLDGTANAPLVLTEPRLTSGPGKGID